MYATDVELYIAETQTGNQIGTENQMTLVCNASNFNVALDTITFFGPNERELICPSPPPTKSSFSDGIITRTDQICSLEILRPSLNYGGVYYCQVRPLHETCFNYTSNQVEVLLTTKLTTNSNNNYALRVALIVVSCTLLGTLLMVVFVACCILWYKRKKDRNQGKTVIPLSSDS